MDYKKKYNLKEKIGIGLCTEVYKAENKENNEIRAIKIVKLGDVEHHLGNYFSREEVINQLKKEIEYMKICGENNENSIKYYESFETKEEFAIVMELADMNLHEFQKDKKFSPIEIYEILNQLNNTFKIMKEKKIIHRDLKPQNILIKCIDDERTKFIVKLCDYSMSEETIFRRFREKKRENKVYMAPEIIKMNDNDYKCDLWSLGIIIYELYFKEVPYKGENEITIYQKIEYLGKEKYIKKTNDEKLDDLIDKLLEKDTNKRLTWDDFNNKIL
jgi:serine/threonine protein kinase